MVAISMEGYNCNYFFPCRALNCVITLGSRNGWGILDEEKMKSIPPLRRDYISIRPDLDIYHGRLTFCIVFLSFPLKPDLALGVCRLRIGALVTHA